MLHTRRATQKIIVALAICSCIFIGVNHFMVTPTAIEIVPNPYGNNLLTAQLRFKTEQPATTTVIVHDKYDAADNLVFVGTGNVTEHIVDVWGLYPGYFNQLEVVIESDTRIDRSVVRELYLPDVLPSYSVASMEGDVRVLGERFILVGSEMFDHHGELRWKMVVPDRTVVFPLHNDRFALNATWGDVTDVSSETIDVYTIYGKLVEEYRISTGVHHEVIEKTPGGNLFVGSHHARRVDAQDTIVEIDRETGMEVRRWDLRAVLNEHRPRWQERSPADWAHINSVWYNPTDNSLTASLKLQNTVVNLDYATGDVRWIIAPPTDWPWQQQQSLLTPTNFDTSAHLHQDWTYLQHHATVLEDQTILIFDNGAGRPGFTDTPDDHDRVVGGGYVRVVQYAVDAEAMTVTKLGEWTDYPDRGSNNKGSAYVFGDNQLMIGYTEFQSVVVRGGEAWEDVLLTVTFDEHRPQQVTSFYRAIPFDVSHYRPSS